MFLDFELFYSRPRFNNADSNSPTPELITSIDHDTSPGAVQPVLPSSTMTTGHLTPWAVAAGDTIARHLFPRRARTYFIITRHVFLVEHELISWCHHSTRFPRRARTDFQIIIRHHTFSSSSTNSRCHHSTRFPRRARTDFLMSSLDTFSSSSTNWFPDYIIRHHSTRFPRQARTSKQSQRAFLKAWLTRGHLASPAMSIFYLVLVPRWLPPPSPTSSSSPS